VVRSNYCRLFDSEDEQLFDQSALIDLGAAMVCEDTRLFARDDSRTPSGYTYLGQFIAHDVSFDSSKGLPAPHTEPSKVINKRHSGLALLSLYGAGPDGSDRTLYQDDGIRLCMGKQSTAADIVGFDLPRSDDGYALIADERNDETVAIAQMHACFVAFHNNVADYLESSSDIATLEFRAVREMVTQHFQSVVLHDFLWRLIPDEIYNDVMKNGRTLFYPAGVPSGTAIDLPVEFTHAAFRFGHSMVRSQYRWNRIISIARAPELFTHSSRNGPDGFRQLHPDWIIDWRNFVDFSGLAGTAARKAINFARKIDVSIATTLGNLPHGERQYGEPASLPARDMIRSQALSIPSGQSLTRQLQKHFGLYVPEIKPGEFAVLHNEAVKSALRDSDLINHTPLWPYLLAEAELRSNGEQLGPLGGRIVMEVLHAQIEACPISILAQSEWQPQLPSLDKTRFTLPDLVAFAGMAYRQ